ncbi:hypothetical protein BCR34DRAFT_660597 [Clohesyomyces aquaticus]|uniref:Uncharacterized protein n=1 Tax=Clohesyomyces aquaticus TaxID=1231657 RepID=A0A1Y2A6C3_9PLEO|nr:hypothetical protein BCR34DRAFT_660597 [Clohesyomyces aquaticus]
MALFIPVGILGLAKRAVAANQDVSNMTSSSSFLNSTSPTPVITTPPNIPTFALPPLPPDFNDIPLDVLKCYDSWASARATNTFITVQVSSLESPKQLPTPIQYSYLTSYVDTQCTTSLYTGLYTTLCDGLARNPEPSEEVSCHTTTSVYGTQAESYWTTFTPEWLSKWSAENTVPLPSCTQAPDREKLCYRLHSAWSWRSSQTQASGSATITQPPGYVLKAEKPTCRTLSKTPPANLTTKSCKFNVDDYEVHYWPSAPLTGSSFCVPNVTRHAGGTRTIPWLPNTAVVSGFTLTSPSVYHFLKGVGISTSIGETKYGKYGHSAVYNISSAIAPNTILTFAQEESDIWVVKPTRIGRGLHAHWEYAYKTGSYNADAMATVQSSAYFDACLRERTLCGKGDKTISQAWYRQYAALSIKEVMDEWDSDEFKHCNWSSQYYQQGPWHDRVDMWIAPGRPWRATPIVTDDGDEPKATPAAEPASTLRSLATRTEDWVPTTTETDEPE